MATPDPLVEEILLTLDASRLPGGALALRSAVQALPQRSRRTVDDRILGVSEQLDILQDLLLRPLKRELSALEALPNLAERLGLPREVDMVIEPPEGPRRRVELTASRRVDVIRTMIDALREAMDDARQRAGTLGPRGRL